MGNFYHSVLSSFRSMPIWLVEIIYCRHDDMVCHVSNHKNAMGQKELEGFIPSFYFQKENQNERETRRLYYVR